MEKSRAARILWRRIAIGLLILLLAVVWITLDSQLGILHRTRARSVEIPNWCGAQIETLEAKDWMDVSVEYRYDDTAPAGTVLSQTPAGGARRKLTGTQSTCPVHLIVSLGRESCRLPETVGREVREVLAELRGYGLRVECVTEASPRPSGTVLFMEPHAGQELPRGATVTLMVSAGQPTQTVRVPDTRGMSRADALLCMHMAQLTVEHVVEIAADGEVGTVVRQSHQPDTVVLAGTRVTLYVCAENDGVRDFSDKE